MTTLSIANVDPALAHLLSEYRLIQAVPPFAEDVAQRLWPEPWVAITSSTLGKVHAAGVERTRTRKPVDVNHGREADGTLSGTDITVVVESTPEEVLLTFSRIPTDASRKRVYAAGFRLINDRWVYAREIPNQMMKMMAQLMTLGWARQKMHPPTFFLKIIDNQTWELRFMPGGVALRKFA